MFRFVYPYAVRFREQVWGITFPDIPEAISYAERQSDAESVAHDVLWTVLDAYIRERRPLPAPSKPVKGQMVADLGPRATIKLALHQMMVEKGVTKAELARRLEVAPTQVDRLLDLEHASTLDHMIAALEAVDLTLQIYVERSPVERPQPVVRPTRHRRVSLTRRRPSRAPARAARSRG